MLGSEDWSFNSECEVELGVRKKRMLFEFDGVEEWTRYGLGSGGRGSRSWRSVRWRSYVMIVWSGTLLHNAKKQTYIHTYMQGYELSLAIPLLVA